MICKILSFPSPAQNLLYEDVLFARAESVETEEILRLWESPASFIVLGRTSCLEDDVDLEATRRQHIPVLRRSSGGGTVMQGKGCLNYTLVLSKAARPQLADLRRSYAVILADIIAALRTVGVSAEFRPLSDLVLKDGERKISGNAQRRGRRVILQHGTILCHYDLALAETCLRVPRSVPVYRAGRGHADFMANIQVPVGRVQQAFLERFQPRAVSNDLEERERMMLDDLLREKEAAVSEGL